MSSEDGPVRFTMLAPDECVVKANPAGDLVCYRNHEPGPDGHYFLTQERMRVLMAFNKRQT